MPRGVGGLGIGTRPVDALEEKPKTSRGEEDLIGEADREALPLRLTDEAERGVGSGSAGRGAVGSRGGEVDRRVRGGGGAANGLAASTGNCDRDLDGAALHPWFLLRAEDGSPSPKDQFAARWDSSSKLTCSTSNGDSGTYCTTIGAEKVRPLGEVTVSPRARENGKVR